MGPPNRGTGFANISADPLSFEAPTTIGVVPLIQIAALPQPAAVRDRVLDALVEAAAESLGRPPESVWATWQEIPKGGYSVGGARPETQPANTHPPVVRVYGRRSAQELAAVAGAIERVFQDELGLEPFVIVEPAPQAETSR